MTTENSTPRTDWEKALERFTALRILFEADDQWGPLYRANVAAELYGRLIKTTTTGVRDEARVCYSELRDREDAELARHMETIYDPLIEAGLTLLRTAAPDLAAVQIKHDIIRQLPLGDYMDSDDELFDIIKADVQRLTGLEA